MPLPLIGRKKAKKIQEKNIKIFLDDARKGNLLRMKTYVKKKNFNEKTLCQGIELALGNRHLNIAEYLLKNFPIDIQQLVLILEYHFYSGLFEVTKYLIEKGCQFSTSSKEICDYYCEIGHLEGMKFFVSIGYEPKKICYDILRNRYDCVEYVFSLVDSKAKYEYFESIRWDCDLPEEPCFQMWYKNRFTNKYLLKNNILKRCLNPRSMHVQLTFL
jgi:hypothetical protein